MLILNTRLVEYKPPPTDHTCPVDVARSRLLPPTGLFFHIAMRQFSKCQHHPWIDCACARRSHSCPAGRIPGGECERKRKTAEILRPKHLSVHNHREGAACPEPAAVFEQDMVSGNMEDVGGQLLASLSHFLLFVLLPVC